MGSRPYVFYDPPLHLVRGDGVWLYDVDGRAYMDLYNNVPIVGHCNPRVADAIATQTRILNTNTRYLGDHLLDYAERLGALTGGALTACAFVNSGSEANDIAWRMAREWTGNRGALTQEFAYHGVTEAIDALSPSAMRNAKLPDHVRTILGPDGYRGPFRRGLPDLGRLYAEDADRAIAALSEAGLKPAAVIIDSAFLTNGMIEPVPGYVAAVFDKVRKAGGLCIADEVQSGFGRMGGHFWGHQHHGVTPDFITIGKPAGNGHPIGVVLTRPEILDHFLNQTAFFSTFGGNNVSCAAGLAVLDEIRDRDLVTNASTTGARFKAFWPGPKGRMPTSSRCARRWSSARRIAIMHWPRWAEACCGCDEASCGARNPDPSTRSCLSRAAAFKRQARAQPGVEMRNVEFLRHQRSRAVAVGSQSPLVISQAMASSSITWATNSTALARSKTGLASVSGAKSQTSSHPDCRATGRPMTKHRSTGFRRKT